MDPRGGVCYRQCLTWSQSQDFSTTGFGTFSYHPLAINDYRFMTSVDRVPLNGSIAFVAQPLRALMDLVALRARSNGADLIG